MSLVSIIVPAYNCAGTIKKCIMSLINQTYEEIEIIIVDDGSSDNTADICKGLQHIDQRIQYIYKENGGVSSARNLALSLVRGVYICFIDADDFLELNTIEISVDLMIRNSVKLVIYNHSSSEEFLSVPDKIETSHLSKIDVLRGLYNRNGFRGFVWNKLFCSSVIRENNIQFDENIHYCEDSLFCCKYIDSIADAIYCENRFYHYILNSNSITRQEYSEKRFSVLEAYKEIISLTEECQDNILQNYISTNYFIHITKLIKMVFTSGQPKKMSRIHKLLHKMKGRRVLLRNSYCPVKYKIIYIMCFLFMRL